VVWSSVMLYCGIHLENSRLLLFQSLEDQFFFAATFPLAKKRRLCYLPWLWLWLELTHTFPFAFTLSEENPHFISHVPSRHVPCSWLLSEIQSPSSFKPSRKNTLNKRESKPKNFLGSLFSSRRQLTDDGPDNSISNI